MSGTKQDEAKRIVALENKIAQLRAALMWHHTRWTVTSEFLRADLGQEALALAGPPYLESPAGLATIAALAFVTPAGESTGDY